MKKILFLFLLIINSIAFAQSDKILIKIIKIYDGDTIKAKLESENKFNIRLYGIDCYETSKINRAYMQAYKDNLTIEEVIEKGLFAKKYLKDLYKNSENIAFEFKGIDKYKRVLGILYFDGININEKMTESGICKIYKFKED